MNISVLIYTKNEEIHLERCLRSVAGSDDIVVVDSFSTDRTRQIAESAGVRFIQHEFTGFGDQRNWSFDNVPLKNEWALVLDADEEVTPELWEEMLRRVANIDPPTAAFRLRRRFHWRGRWVPRSSQYPSWVVRLIRAGRVRYANRGHSETQTIDGRVQSLEHDLIDENLKGLDAFRERQRRYATQEAVFELASEARWNLKALFSDDPLIRRAHAKALLSRLPCRGMLAWFYLYLLRGGFLEGFRGWELALEKARYQNAIARKKKELKARPAA